MEEFYVYYGRVNEDTGRITRTFLARSTSLETAVRIERYYEARIHPADDVAFVQTLDVNGLSRCLPNEGVVECPF